MTTADEFNHSATGSYIHIAVPHSSYTLHCTVLSPKETGPFPGDINTQSSQWNNGKMKIAYNSGNVQIGTLNFNKSSKAFEKSASLLGG